MGAQKRPAGIPKKVVIAGMTYRIEICQKPSDVDVLKRRALWGQVDYWEQRIALYKQDEANMRLSLLHEIVHAVLAAIGEGKVQKNEAFVTRFSTALADTLTRNGLVA